jgi:hypothetical protein
MEEAHYLRIRNKVIITNGFTKCGVQFKPPKPTSSSYGLEFLDFKIGSPQSLSPHRCMLWNMEDMYGAIKRPHQYLG